MDRRKRVSRNDANMRAPGGIVFWCIIGTVLYTVGWALWNL